MLVIIDNYDSFTYNLVQYFACLTKDILVFTHDEIDITSLNQLRPTKLVISPGPKGPEDAGISVKAIKHFYNKIPVLGVCLGHQCLSYAFGGEIIAAPEILHGKTSSIFHQQQGLFRELPSPFLATRYHSLIVCPNTLPDDFTIDAWTDRGTIMGISHRKYPLFGLQFHPEAILTQHGMALLSNFINYEY